MSNQIALAVFAGALIVYVIILQMRLSRQNLFIRTTLKKLTGVERGETTMKIIELIEEVHKYVQYGPSAGDKILDQEITDFIYGNTDNMKIYMHYTREESDAKKILSEGFCFEESFYYTALPVTNDNLDLKMKHIDRKLFGDYLIIICVSEEIADHYTREIEKAGLRNYSFENILTEIEPVKNENSDMIYRLSPKFVKGYVNYKTGEIVRNSLFDPFYNSPEFMKNISKYESSRKL